MLTKYQQVQNTQEARKPKPLSPQPPQQQDFELRSDMSAFIKTISIPKNGKAKISIPGCTTVILYQSFNSAEAQSIWNAFQNSNPLYARSLPKNPQGRGLMVILDPKERVERVISYPKGTKFVMNNHTHPVGAEYTITNDIIIKGQVFTQTYMEVLSPIPYAIIPGVVYGGLKSDAPVRPGPKP